MLYMHGFAEITRDRTLDQDFAYQDLKSLKRGKEQIQTNIEVR